MGEYQKLVGTITLCVVGLLPGRLFALLALLAHRVQEERPMSKPGVGVRWFRQLEMSGTEWGPWGREPAAGRAASGLADLVNRGERHRGAIAWMS